jgi:hypothetical protein
VVVEDVWRRALLVLDHFTLNVHPIARLLWEQQRMPNVDVTYSPVPKDERRLDVMNSAHVTHFFRLHRALLFNDYVMMSAAVACFELEK